MATSQVWNPQTGQYDYLGAPPPVGYDPTDPTQNPSILGRVNPSTQPGNPTLNSPYGATTRGVSNPQQPPSDPTQTPPSTAVPRPGTGNTTSNQVVTGTIEPGTTPTIPIAAPGKPPVAPAPTPGNLGYSNSQNLGNGWTPFQGTPTTPAQAYQMGSQYGYQGQALLNWVQKNYPNLAGGGTVYPDKNNIVAFVDSNGQAYYVNFGSDGRASLIANNPDGAGGSGQPGSGSAGGPLGGPNAVQPISYSPYATDPAVEAEITRLLSQGNAAIDPSNPNISVPTLAYKQQADAATQASREALAGRAAYEGLNSGGSGSGAMDSAIQSQQEQEGRDIGSYQGGLIQNQIQLQIREVEDAMQYATGEEKNALTLKLAQLNDQLQRAGLGQQNQQFYDSLSANLAGQNNSLNNILTNFLLTGG